MLNYFVVSHYDYIDILSNYLIIIIFYPNLLSILSYTLNLVWEPIHYKLQLYNNAYYFSIFSKFKVSLNNLHQEISLFCSSRFSRRIN